MQRRTLLKSGLALPATAWAASSSVTLTLTLAAASDLRYALDELVRDFRATRPAARIDVIYGSSGKLSAQIQNGAPFDIFFSADQAYARQLERLNLTHGDVRPYAVGQLALWSMDPQLGVMGLDELVRHPRVKRFAIANPEHAPYGQRAMEALRHRGLLDWVQARLVLGDNVTQAAQFVQTGAAQAGLVSLAHVLAPSAQGQGAWTRVPQTWHSPLIQALVVLRRAAFSPLAAELLQHLQTPPVQALWQRYGFALPQTSKGSGGGGTGGGNGSGTGIDNTGTTTSSNTSGNTSATTAANSSSPHHRNDSRRAARP